MLSLELKKNFLIKTYWGKLICIYTFFITLIYLSIYLFIYLFIYLLNEYND